MSYCRKEGKDVIMFVTKEDHTTTSASNINMSMDDLDDEPGLILPSGEINWNCPCLGGMATGPCGVPFRSAFSCFHDSRAEPKGSDCIEEFRDMHMCMSKYPELYKDYSNDDDGEITENGNNESAEDSASKSDGAPEGATSAAEGATAAADSMPNTKESS
ncbi:PREDICTED: mitochondrial intermembrane space import and assembly protein 40-B-like [Priapulus caudatus]|uniref:Mitochondrial intermembrane space import and assembly protein 40-B-like n=1 Tax=Priapulus caudatus TaxID=37621 RepID=A0ABM1F2Q0_PRICU|nr:PREDICTED: mitochondrial intermembrane space import and assembly protein 40-B-like [Priapulus caudatus]